MPTALDLYRVTGRAGNVGTPGAPILHFDLLVNSSAGTISGQARALAKPSRRRTVKFTSTTSPGPCTSSFSVGKSPWWWRSRERTIERYRPR